ncbi:MAG: hypothetical protein GH154_04400 [Firmicutes bacterium]|nr:hypothetical protein [Bacillota bacterium]
MVRLFILNLLAGKLRIEDVVKRDEKLWERRWGDMSGAEVKELPGDMFKAIDSGDVGKNIILSRTGRKACLFGFIFIILTIVPLRTIAFAETTDQTVLGNLHVVNNTLFGKFNYSSENVEGFLEAKESFLGGVSGFVIGTNIGLGSPEANFGKGKIDLKVCFTNDNPVLERSALFKIGAEWLPQWNLASTRLKAKLGLRSGCLSVTTTTEPIDPPYPSQLLYGAESGLSISKEFKGITFETEITGYVTYSFYNHNNQVDNSGIELQAGSRVEVLPVILRLGWKGTLVKYNPDKYFFLDSMREDSYEVSIGYMGERFGIGLFNSLDIRAGIEFARKRNLTGMGVQVGRWLAKGIFSQNLLVGKEATTISLGRDFSDAYFEAYWTKNQNYVDTSNGNIFGVSFKCGIGPKPAELVEVESYKSYVQEDDGPFNALPDFRLPFAESMERLDTINKVIRYTRGNLGYIPQNGYGRDPKEVFELRGGDCDEQALFQLHALKTHGYDDLYELAFISPRKAHAFSYGKDKRTGKEYIWEYGRVFRLDFDPGLNLSEKEKMAAILSSRSYTEDWEHLWIFKPPSSDYEDYNYQDMETVYEAWSDEVDIPGDTVQVIPESGIRLFIGTEFEE